MPRPTLSKVYRNRIREVLEQGGLDPAGFQWSNSTLGLATEAFPVLTRKGGGVFFGFVTPHAASESWQIICTPGWGDLRHAGPVPGGWDEVVSQFRKWIPRAREEIQAPDLWASLDAVPLSLAASSDQGGNQPFSAAECDRIRELLVGVRARLAEETQRHPALKESLGEITASLARLEQEAPAGRGRADWKNQFVGCVVNVAVAAAFSPGARSAFFASIGALVRGTAGFMGG